MPPPHPLPKNWPPDLPYFTTPIYSPTLTSAQVSSLRTLPSSPSSSSSSIPIVPLDTPRGPCPLVKITPISSPSHPAYPQAGLFATRDLKPSSFIVLYLGVIHSSTTITATASRTNDHDPDNNDGQQNDGDHDANSHDRAHDPHDPHASSDYDLSLDRFLGIGVDAARGGNEARFVNDYRGVAGGPNAEFREVWDERGKTRGMGVFVLSEGKGKGNGNGNGNGSRKGKGKGNGKCLDRGAGKVGRRGIRKGEEILVSYGRGFWGARREASVAEGEGEGEGDEVDIDVSAGVTGEDRAKRREREVVV